MKKTLLILATFICTMANAQDISGSWIGELNAGATKLHIVFNFEKDKCTMDSPDQGAKGISATVNLLSADSVNITIPAIAGTYVGKLVNGTIKGRFAQMGRPFALDLKPGVAAKRNRPQMPKAPYPYKTEEVSFSNTEGGANFTGTLTLPIGYEKMKKVPVALMATGSGQQNRDEEVMEHKPFLVIADFLARNGVATLRYDDRGVGGSTGNVMNARTKEFAEDAEAGVKYLKATKRFGKVGIIGHSEGGEIAFMLGKKNAVDFIVSMAGPGIKGDTLIVEQTNAMLKLMGQPATHTVNKLRDMFKTKDMGAWYSFFIDYDPAEDIKACKCPVMAINGSMDKQVLPSSNLVTIKKLLPKNSLNLIKEYDGLNHLFQHCKTGNIDEYINIEETISPEVLSDMAEWIKKVAK